MIPLCYFTCGTSDGWSEATPLQASAVACSPCSCDFELDDKREGLDSALGVPLPDAELAARTRARDGWGWAFGIIERECETSHVAAALFQSVQPTGDWTSDRDSGRMTAWKDSAEQLTLLCTAQHVSPPSILSPTTMADRPFAVVGDGNFVGTLTNVGNKTTNYHIYAHHERRSPSKLLPVLVLIIHRQNLHSRVARLVRGPAEL